MFSDENKVSKIDSNIIPLEYNPLKIASNLTANTRVSRSNLCSSCSGAKSFVFIYFVMLKTVTFDFFCLDFQVIFHSVVPVRRDAMI